MFHDRSPIYRQIADQIRHDVASGRLAEEEQVMSTTQYATHHRINPATAAKAFAELVDDGVLYKRRGIGMFVAPGAAAKLRAERRAEFAARVVDPLVDEAQLLGLERDEVLETVRREFDARATDRSAR